MSSQIQTVKEKLNFAISKLCETSWMFVKDPTCDFIRERKLPLREVVSVLLCMEGGSLTGELLRYFGCSQHNFDSMDTCLSGFFHPLFCHAQNMLKRTEQSAFAPHSVRY